MTARPAVDADLGSPTAGPRQLVKKADACGWWTVATVGSGQWATRHRDDDDEPVLRDESSLVVRGRKGRDGKFVAIWRTIPSLVTQPPAVCYWWAREQRGRIERDPQTSRDVAFEVALWKQENDGKISAPKEREIRARAYEVVEWTSDRPTPHAVSVTVLKKLLEGEKSWTELLDEASTASAARVPKARRSAPAGRKVRTDGVS